MCQCDQKFYYGIIQLNNSACTERYKKSSVSAMQRVLNDLDKNFKSVSESLYPVTNEICQTGSLVVKI